MRNILVTGASGFIGKSVCEGLLAKGFTVVGTDNSSNGLEHENFTFVAASITSQDQIKEIIIRYNIDGIVHLACSVDNDFPDVLSSEQEKRSADVDKFLYKLAVSESVRDMLLLSTHMVYAPTKSREPIRETMPIKPYTLYGKIKLNSEKALQAAVKKTGVTMGVIMRTAPVYSKTYIENLHSKVYDPVQKCAYMYGYGDYGYSFTCIYNLIDFIVGILNNNNAVNYQGEYNVCDSKPTTAKEIVEFERGIHKLSVVMQRNYSTDNVKKVLFANNIEMKTQYRYNDSTIACSNITYDNTKAQRISRFHWKLSNTK